MHLPLILLLFFMSCAQKPEEKTAEAIDRAQTYLTSNDCQSAIEVLEEAKRQNDNPIYLQVLASAYACRAGFSEINFIQTDIPNLDVDSNPTPFFRSIALLSQSYESEADSENYIDMQTALSVLLDSDGGAQPSQANRNTKYGDRKSGDMALQALFLSIAQFGKFLNFYGNVDASGVKGGPTTANVDEQGSSPSTCFIDYTGDAETFISVSPGGACTSSAQRGHPDLAVDSANLSTTKKRLCDGLVILTNILDILENVSLSSNSSLGDLSSVSSEIGTLRTSLTTLRPDLETLLTTTSSSVCQEIVEDTADWDRLQLIYAMLFEQGLP